MRYYLDLPDALYARLDECVKRRGGQFGTKAHLARTAIAVFVLADEGLTHDAQALLSTIVASKALPNIATLPEASRHGKVSESQLAGQRG